MSTPRTPITSISRDQYYQLVGLRLVAQQHTDALEAIKKAVVSITQETEGDWGHSSDFLYEDYGVDGLLSRLNLTVIDPQP